MEYIFCQLCGSKASGLLLTCQDNLHRLGGTFNVVKCKHCGLIYTNPRPTREEIGRYYPNEYEPYKAVSVGWIRGLAGIEASYALRRRWRSILRFKNVGTILDVGCGAGAFLHVMEKHGWSTYGVEVSEKATTHALTEFGLNVFQGALMEAEFPDGSFDVVTLWHVLEHVHDLIGTLNEIYRILRNDGLLVIATPNAESLQAKLFKQYWAGWDIPRHLYHFTPCTLKTLLELHEFEILRKGCFFGAHDCLMMSLSYWLEEKLGNQLVGHPEKRLFRHWLAKYILRLPLMPVLSAIDRLQQGPVMTFFVSK